jgi:3-phenylpropionate/cinnamic acid dioxygenase small subunit
MSPIADELALMQLVSRYCHLLDDRRFDEVAALHADDATFTVMGATYRGPAEIEKFFVDNVPPEARGRHLCVNTVLDVDGDQARGVTDYVVVVPGGSGFAITNPAAVGRYHDRFVRVADGWRLAARQIVFFGEDQPGD